MNDELDRLCSELTELINDLELVLPTKEWMRIGWLLADSIAAFRDLQDRIETVETERDFWAEPDYFPEDWDETW